VGTAAGVKVGCSAGACGTAVGGSWVGCSGTRVGCSGARVGCSGGCVGCSGATVGAGGDSTGDWNKRAANATGVLEGNTAIRPTASAESKSRIPTVRRGGCVWRWCRFDVTLMGPLPVDFESL